MQILDQTFSQLTVTLRRYDVDCAAITKSQWLNIKKIIAPTDVPQRILLIEWLETQTDEDFIISKGMIVIIHGRKRERDGASLTRSSVRK